MFKPFSLLLFIAVFVWIGAILFTTKPAERMERACSPISLVQRVTTATVMLLDDGWARGARDGLTQTEYACRYVLWKVFYEGEWQASTPEAKAAALDREGGTPVKVTPETTSRKTATATAPAGTPSPKVAP